MDIRDEIRKILSEIREANPSTITVYHGTHTSKEPKISSEGLKASDSMGYNNAGWYVVATDFESALFHATPEDKSEAIVFEFEVPLTNEKWEGYPYFWPPHERNSNSKWFALKQPLTPDMIKNVHRVSHDDYLDQKSKGLNEEVIEETQEGQKDLEEFTNDILQFMGEVSFKTFEDNKIYYGEDNAALLHFPMVTTGKMKGDKYKEISEFVADTAIKIIPTTFIDKEGTQGRLEYASPDENFGRELFTIKLKYSQDQLAEVNKLLTEKPYGEVKPGDIYFKLYYIFYSTLLHELQHAYDAWRSKGKAFLGQMSKDYTEKQQLINKLEKKPMSELTPEERKALSDGYEAYLNLTHEINARFAQAMQRTRITTVDDKWNEIMYPWDKVLANFRREFKGWRILSDKMKRRLVNRLAKAYQYESEHLQTAEEKYGKETAEEIGAAMTENVQQAEKLYFRDGKIPEEIKEGILDVTGGDSFTKLVSDLVYHFSKFGGGFKGYKDVAKRFHELLSDYNKNVFPVKGVDLHKYGVDGDLHVLDLLGQLQNREKAVHYLRQLPSIAIRNLKSVIRTPMEHEYSLNSITDHLRTLSTSLESLPHKDELKKGIMNKIFASNNSLEQMAKIAEKFAQGFNRYAEDFGKEDVLENLENINADLVKDDGDILIIRANDQQAIESLGCTSQWCFSRPGAIGDWDAYASYGYVYVIFNFEESYESSEFLLTYLPDRDLLYLATNVPVDDVFGVGAEEYMNNKGIDSDAIYADEKVQQQDDKMVAEIRKIIRESIMDSDARSFDLMYFRDRIPFLKNYDVNYAPDDNPHPRMPARIELNRIVDQKDVTIPAGDEIHTFPKITAISEFTFYPRKINDNIFYVISIDNKIIPWKPDGMRDITYKVLTAASRMVNEKMSDVIEIVVPEGEAIPNSEINAAINKVNKLLFEFEKNTNQWQVDFF